MDSTTPVADDVTDTTVQLEVWSDVACPWCYVGRRHLAIALADMQPHERPHVTWRAYQLDPTIPEGGVDADAYYQQRFGDDLPRILEGQERLVAIGKEIGIDFRFDRRRTVPNTRLAHRAMAAADRIGERDALLDCLFAANFERGIDIGDPDALRAVIADQLGDEQTAASLVEAARTDDTLEAAVERDVTTARELGITGVPCFVADRAIAVPGAVPPPVLAQLLAEAATRRDGADE